MSELALRIRSVQERLKRLVKERDDLRAKLEALETTTRREHRSADVLKARIDELERENEVLRTSRPKNEAGNTEAKQRIDELVNEIDRCLSLINA